MIDPFNMPIATVYSVLRVPAIKLKVPRFSEPHPMLVCGLVIFTYFLVTSGIVYDVLLEPPGMGQTQDPVTGSIRPVAFMPGRVNVQYIIEGLSAGFLFTVGGFGIIMLDWSNDKTVSSRNRYLLVLSSVICILVSYNMCVLFLKIKVTGLYIK
mmetsp:Transcript_31346/g.43485  ORF Transcript_31346/g.43485 Transcript_31346/m.43485 type:complete len:154 (+) Transcript_31346:110-571(+)